MEIQRKIFTDDELCRFWDRYNEICEQELPDWRWQGYFLLALSCTCALRRKELCELEVGDCLEFPYPIIHVRIGKTTKCRPGEANPRDVDVLPQFHDHYLRHVKRLKEMGRQYVFKAYNISFERPLTVHGMSWWWYRVLEDCGLPKRGTHAGRRSYATYVHRIPFVDEEGREHYMAPMSLVEQLGHASPSLLFTYSQPMPGHRYPNTTKLRWPDHVAGKEF